MNPLQKVIATLQSYEKDSIEFYDKKNNAAGTRVRKGCQEGQKQLNLVRKNVIEVRHDRQAKPTPETPAA